jgi:cysteate synthase
MHYALRCVACGKTREESREPFLLDCGEDHAPSLLRAEYGERRLTPQEGAGGIFRYGGWLPVKRRFAGAGRTIVFRSGSLGKALGLSNLFIAFSGYWPERDADLLTCSFKELEALCVCARIPEGFGKTMVVASAGNTGRAFLHICSARGIPLLVVVPRSALPDMWMVTELRPEVRLAVVDGDYADAIALASDISRMDGFFGEGGAKNVARRDGMGSVLLSAVEEIGWIPAHYVQAVGSGTGGIAAWEMARRLAADGRFTDTRMRLHLVQNEPFAPMTRAWASGSRELPVMSEEAAKRDIALLHSGVLSNRTPPYGIAGGVFDALKDTGGRMYAVASGEARSAGALFESVEGIDLDPAAEVALAGLIRAVREGAIPPADAVLFNATGGGARRMAAEGRTRRLEPDYVFSAAEAKSPEDIAKKLSDKRPRRAS